MADIEETKSCLLTSLALPVKMPWEGQRAWLHVAQHVSKFWGFCLFISPKNHFSVIGPVLSTFSAWCIVNALVVLLQENSTKRFDEFCLVSHKI